MKLLLLCLGLTLVCAQEEGNHEVVTSNFDVSKLSGEWYTAMLASDVKERIEENSVMRSFVEYIQVQDNSLTFKLHVEIEGECLEYTVSCDETGKNGVCNAIYAGFATITLIEAVYSDYFIFHLINFTNDGTFQMMALYARTPDVSPNLKKRFEELCQQHGIPKDNILDMTNVDRCSHLRGSHETQSSSAE
ncbi:salivary lipocalin-like [Saccopteryx bilineata]|uniref:salivary lipocalin-like n=1 Tax=Saccopteryx bilineata TaxID=59482 RepID=UPI00338E4A77